MVRHGGSSAGSYLADPTSPIPSHCAAIVATSTLRVKSVVNVKVMVSVGIPDTHHNICSADFTVSLCQCGCQCSLRLLIQPWICAPGTHYGWVDRGSEESEVSLILIHMTSARNQTPDILMMSLVPDLLNHVALT